MTTVRNKYHGDLRTEAMHVRSGEIVLTDAPVDNQGKGEKFSPTDLLAASLGSCMITIMGIKARDMGININGTEVETQKIMGGPPRRVIELRVRISVPSANIGEKDRIILERAAKTCPVALSLSPELKQTVSFNWA